MLERIARPLARALAYGSVWPSQFRTLCSVASRLQVCIVGSGPAGMYTANRLLKALGDEVNIGIIDRLPTPFGLVRSGVAPDHPDTKNVINGFSSDAADPRCSYLGNVQVGRNVSVAELQQLFHCVVLAYGAESDRRLGIPGEELKGVLPAREFVWWYNGHPDARDVALDLSRVESVAVCGLGNVALDCARLLLRPADELATTDVAEHALQQLRSSKVKQVSILARRGPVQAACTPKELKELLQCTRISNHVDPSVLSSLSSEDQAEMKAVRLKRRIHELLQQSCKPLGEQEAARQLQFHFFSKPVEVLADDQGRVSGLKAEQTRVVKRPDGSLAAEGTGQFTTLPAQLVLKSIGYKSLPMPGVPFDSRAGIVPNEAGRVAPTTSYAPATSTAAVTDTTTAAGAEAATGTASDAAATGVGTGTAGAGAGPSASGLYVVGWLKRGPTGIIGTNLADAQGTVSSILSDVPGWVKQGRVGGLAGLRNLLQDKGHEVVDWGGWCKLDKVEVERGQAAGKPREKIVSVPEMMEVLHS